MASTLQDGENPPILKKKLNDLRVVDLRAELDKRELDKSGVKVALIERLTKALEDEGHDPEEFLFEVTGEISPGKKLQSKRVNSKLPVNDSRSVTDGVEEFDFDDSISEKLTNETESVVSLEGLDDSIIDDEDKLDSDDEKLAIDEKDEIPKDSNPKVAVDEKVSAAEKVNNSSEAKKSSVESKLSNSNSGKSALGLEDTNILDASSVVKSNDNASLIVHVDDTQSDVDGDLDLTMCDGTSVSGKATPVNVDSAGTQETSVKKLMEESVIIDDNDNNNDSSEVLELENDDMDEPPPSEKKVTKKDSATVSNNGTGLNATNANSDAKKQETKKADSHHDSKEAGSKDNESGASNTDSTAASATTNKTKSSSNAVATKDAKAVDKDRGSTDRVKRVSVSSCNLWVSGLSTSTKASDLRMLFSKYGRIIAAKVVSNPKMPGRRCYGFITMFSSEEASKCIQHLHRTELNGKMISVERTKNTLPGVMKTTKSAPASKKPAPRPHPKPSPESKKVEKPKSEPEPEPIEKKEKELVKEEEKKEKPKTVTVDVAEPSGSETKEHEKSSKDSKPREKSRDKSREKSRDHSRERMRGPGRSFRDPRSGSMRGPHYRDYRSRMGRGRPYGTRGRGRGMMGNRGMMHNDRGSFRKPFFSRRPMTSSFKARGNMLTFQKIKEERLKQRQRQRERELRETERRRVQDMLRQKEIERKQREEALRLERERERLRIDREKLERERETILRLEREKQKLERERLEREREELRRREQIRLDEPRRTATKRTFEARTNIRESDPYWEDRKRPTRVTPNATNRFHDFEHRNERVSSFERHDTFERRGGGTERFEAREKGGERAEFDTLHRPGGGRRGEPQVQVREERKVIERDHRFERPLVKEEFRGGRDREIRGSNRGIRDAPIRRPPATEGWKSGNHDRRVTDLSRSNDRSERYLVSGKGAVNVSSTSAYSGSSGRSYGGDRETWSGNERSVGKSYGSSTGLLSSPHWGSGDSRKLDSSHSQSWSSQSDRWGSGASSLDTRNTRGQPSLSGQGVLSQPTSSLYSSSVPPVISHSLSSSTYGSDRYMPGMRRYN